MDSGAWTVTWLPGRAVSRLQAIAAMKIAEAVTRQAEELKDPLCPVWRQIDAWAAELGMTGVMALNDALASPEEHAARPSSLERTIVQFRVTTTQLGKRTRVNISAHDGAAQMFAAPFDVSSITVDVEGGRPRADTTQYFAELIRALHRALNMPPVAELEPARRRRGHRGDVAEPGRVRVLTVDPDGAAAEKRGTTVGQVCACPTRDGIVYHNRAMCIDPVMVELDWFKGESS